MNEVFEELVLIDAVPGKFPFEPETDVVVSVPNQTEKVHRAGLIAAFLAAGFPVKDAGEFAVASFKINNRPWWHDREGFERNLFPQGVDLGDIAELPMKQYDGLAGMEISLNDPTSLWAPDLLANQNLSSDYFLRLFEMSFDDVVQSVVVEDVYAPQELEAYRARISSVNNQIRTHNAAVRRYTEDAEAYEQRHEEYLALHGRWQSKEQAAYNRRYDEYESSWQGWSAENQVAVISARAEGRADPRWRSAEPREASFSLEETSVRTRLPERTEAAMLDGEELVAALESSQARTVACRRLKLLAEVIDGETGHVVWVGNATMVARATRTDSYLLRETVARLTER